MALANSKIPLPLRHFKLWPKLVELFTFRISSKLQSKDCTQNLPVLSNVTPHETPRIRHCRDRGESKFGRAVYQEAVILNSPSTVPPMTRLLAILTTGLLLSACASTVSVTDLRNVNEGSTTVAVEMTYDSAYRIVAAESRRCFERTLPGATVTVRTDLYSDTKTAEISIAGALMTSNIAEIVFDIRSTGPTTSEVKAYYRKKSSEAVGNAMRAWLKGDKTVCHA